ncbi:MAG: insulinase family protein [Bacteroidaceae bacterium]|nr:insulinase family protein [Bacteroidaceae bacterium]
MNTYLTHRLSNGLQVVHCPHAGNVSYCGFIVNVGTRDEAVDEYGLAHLVEHTIFKGTARRRAYHIRNRMELVGGELNAFTSKEETVIYSIFPSQCQERAMELLGDLVANASFPDVEFEKEREVVVEEIEMYRDTPSELIYDEFENRLFAGHALGHNILGTPDDLMQISPEKARAFLKRFYVPQQMVFFSLGSMAFDKVVRYAERYFSTLTDAPDVRHRVVPQPIQPFAERLSCDTHQTHVVWGRRTYSLYDNLRLPMLLMNNILGGPCLNSLLNVALREQRGYVYTVESAITNYTDTGIFSVYFGTDVRHVDKCMQRVRKVLDSVRRTYLTGARLVAAKKQYLGQLQVAEDNNEGLALAIGKGFLRHGTILAPDEQKSRIEAISLDEMRQVAEEMLDADSWSLLIFEP